ncbi:hypothetical protein GCM10025868_26430 [Angustibacter aerolatus]|uniref:Uncharacterized protein n=1 Tax=Angustibacter aerolatus TaxID=1162965 RepID=A0ABQ6JJ06_9ACTN|nr:hypothetical protein GCM10025868_26430 [Angustibacter aerolatus]
MKNAKGTATSTQSTVTAAATSSVRPMIRRYTGSPNRPVTLSSVNVRTTWLVNGSVVHTAVAKIAASAPR